MWASAPFADLVHFLGLPPGPYSWLEGALWNFERHGPAACSYLELSRRALQFPSLATPVHAWAGHPPVPPGLVGFVQISGRFRIGNLLHNL